MVKEFRTSAIKKVTLELIYQRGVEGSHLDSRHCSFFVI